MRASSLPSGESITTSTAKYRHDGLRRPRLADGGGNSKSAFAALEIYQDRSRSDRRRRSPPGARGKLSLAALFLVLGRQDERILRVLPHRQVHPHRLPDVLAARHEDAVGEWAVADRVFVARGEYIGQTVRVDLPVWKYTQDSFVLPAEDQKKRGQRKPPTGVLVNFGTDSSDRETILVDFEGGKRTFELPAPTVEGVAPKPVRVDDVSSVEVVMLSPEGKLLARNSAADTADEDRQKRRTKYLARIKEIREGKPGGAGRPAGGLDNR